MSYSTHRVCILLQWIRILCEQKLSNLYYVIIILTLYVCLLCVCPYRYVYVRKRIGYEAFFKKGVVHYILLNGCMNRKRLCFVLLNGVYCGDDDDDGRTTY